MKRRIKRIFFLLFGAAILIPLNGQHRYRLNQSKVFQTIDGFGASDAWSDDFLLKMDDSARLKAADLLFSRKINGDGSYAGIGLSIWRHNLGAGSQEQGDSSGIPDPARRTGCYLGSNGIYDWNKQEGVRGLIRAARERGLEKLVVFSNSPPVSITKNGKAYSSICGESNLDPQKDQMFADFIVKTLKHFEEENIKVDFISPVNEPEWGWCRRDNQEGCPYTNTQIADIARKTGDGLALNQLTAKVLIPESGLLVFANSGMRSKPGRQNQIKDFFSDRSKNYVGGNKNSAGIICAHGYFTEWPLWLMRHVRKTTANKCRKYGLTYWMSEYCILRKTREIEGGGRDPGMTTALYVSRVLHHDLVYGNASAWCWWLGISTADFKDGLTYINSDGTGLTDTKTLWALGNYSQFIHPGAVRIEVKGTRNKKFCVSAYKNKGSEDIIIVIINMNNDKQTLEIKGFPEVKIKCWETSEVNSLKRIKVEQAGDNLMVSPLSVTTFVLSP